MTTINEHPAAADLPAWENKRLREENGRLWDELIDARDKLDLWRSICAVVAIGNLIGVSIWAVDSGWLAANAKIVIYLITEFFN